MNIKFFLIYISAIFFVEFFLLPLFGLSFKINLFAVFVLVLVFLDDNVFKPFFYIMPFVIFFDFWSGGVFGSFSFAIFFVMLAIFFAKKFFLASGQKKLLSFFLIFLFYQLYSLLFLGLDKLFTNLFSESVKSIGGYPVSSLFDYSNFAWLAVLIIIFMFYESRTKSRSR